MNWDSDEIRDLLNRALREDIGPGDATTSVLVPEDLNTSAVFVAKQAGVLAGLPLVSRIFRILDPTVKVHEPLHDGLEFVSGTQLCRVSGHARAILTGERVALNLLQRLCGIASITAKYVRMARSHGIQILDTRKTTPLLRALEKYAVHVGGGINHRMGLYDGVMVKDNHLQIEPDFGRVLKSFKDHGRPSEEVEIEVDSPAALQDAIQAGARWFLLDNMTPNQIRECVKMKQDGFVYEVSGGVSESNLAEYLIPGVDAISIGGLTHSTRSLDISMKIDYPASGIQ
ncbi:carboxylating nicotinate-nucleotide diphosphorylase [bacterium]|nr:carboxylating nicotinate-nucleotide diphosphorylase [bacterium]